MATIHEPMTTTANAAQYVVHQYYDKRYLERLIASMYWYQGCEKRELPKNTGKKVWFHAYKKLGIGTNLTEGTKPTSKVMSSYNVSAQLTEYGDFTSVSDVMELTAISSVIEQAVDVLAEQSADTMDKYIRYMAFNGAMHITPVGKSLSVGVRQRYTGSASAMSAFHNKVIGFTLLEVGSLSGVGAAGAISASANFGTSAWEKKITLRDVRKAVTLLRQRNVQPLDGQYFLGIASPGALEHLRDDTATGGWVDWQKYTDNTPMMKGEVGRAERVRFVETTNAWDYPLGNANLSVTIITVIGKGALGVVDFQSVQDVQNGKNENSIIIKRANQYQTLDPLDQVAGTVGWKWIIAASILNPSCGVHLMGIRKAA
jgi:N4-gp56 family major capsid protein